MKKITVIVALVCVMTMLVSCTQNGNLLMEGSDILRGETLYDDEVTPDEGQFMDGVRNFSANLCQKIYLSDGSLYTKNTAVSPLSVYMALALAVECSQGETREQILNVLGLGYEQVRNFTGSLYSVSIRQRGDESELSLQEDLTNSVWLQTGQNFSEECLKILADEYFCSSFETDFAGDNGGANRKIRAFVKEKTKGLIDSNFDLDPSTVFALINTLYLKSLWNSSGFELSETAEKYDFYCQDGTVERDELLIGGYTRGKKITEEDYSAMFATSVGCRLYFMVPNEGKTLQDVFTAENIKKTIQASYYADDKLLKIHYNTRCIFPGFDADYSGELNKIISDWGAKDLFDPEKCNFGSILSDSDAYCGKIVHKTKLEVDEKGIEGAAVTIMMNATSAGPDGWTTKYEDFIVNRAFGYVLTDGYGNILFAGTVAKI